MSCRFVALLVSLSMGLLAPGCGGQSINKAQANRIKLGMSVSEVEEILGKGKLVDAAEVGQIVNSSLESGNPPAGGKSTPKLAIDLGELRGLRWGSDRKSVTVIFRSDRVFRVFSQGL